MLFNRVIELAKKKEGSIKGVAEKLGILRQTFNGYLCESRQDNLWPLLPRLLAIYPDVSRDWLFFGEGEIFDGNADEQNITIDFSGNFSQRLDGDFSLLFEIIYEKYSDIAISMGSSPSVLGFSKFLGLKNDGKAKAWKKGQWPSAKDCWWLAKKFILNIEWLLTGEGEPFDENSAEKHSLPSQEEYEALKDRLAELVRENAELRSRVNVEAGGSLQARLSELEATVRQLQTRLLVDGVGDKAVATSIGKAAGGQG